jgi:hypothetical protein
VTWTQITLLAQELRAMAERDSTQPNSLATSTDAVRLASLVLEFEYRRVAGPIRGRSVAPPPLRYAVNR